MFHNLKALIALFIIEKMQARGENNITSSRGHRLTQFGCVPQENWNVIKSSHNTNEVVCMSKNYNVDSRPSEIAINPIFVEIEQSTIKDINEKKKTITMDINMILFWRDERINASFPEDTGIIWLPPVTSEARPSIFYLFLLLNQSKRFQVIKIKIQNIILISSPPSTNVTLVMSKHFITVTP